MMLGAVQNFSKSHFSRYVSSYKNSNDCDGAFRNVIISADEAEAEIWPAVSQSTVAVRSGLIPGHENSSIFTTLIKL